VQKGITEWIIKWQKRNWQTTNKKPVKNADLWRKLSKEAQRHQIRWHWIKGHSGHEGNELADALANKAIDKLLKGRN
jgi:ribonuclease HI